MTEDWMKESGGQKNIGQRTEGKRGTRRKDLLYLRHGGVEAGGGRGQRSEEKGQDKGGQYIFYSEE